MLSPNLHDLPPSADELSPDQRRRLTSAAANLSIAIFTSELPLPVAAASAMTLAELHEAGFGLVDLRPLSQRCVTDSASPVAGVAHLRAGT